MLRHHDITASFTHTHTHTHKHMHNRFTAIIYRSSCVSRHPQIRNYGQGFI